VQVPFHKHLGILLSEDLRWKKHIDYCSGRALQKIGLLRRLSNRLSRQQKESIYLCVIRPALEYGCVIYDGCLIGDVLRLEYVQRRAAVVCTGAYSRTSSALLLDELYWNSLKSRRKLIRMSFFYNIVNGHVPLYLQRKISIAPVRSMRTRLTGGRSLRILERFCRLESSRRSFFNDCARVWNGLDDELRDSSSMLVFRNRYALLLGLGKKIITPHAYCRVAGDGIGRFVTQMRLGLSFLNNQRFTHNLTDNPFCPMCVLDLETPSHFFLSCPKYDEQRNLLYDDIKKVVMHIMTSYNVHIDIDGPDKLLNLILKGFDVPQLHSETNHNLLLFKAVSRYILASNRIQTLD